MNYDQKERVRIVSVLFKTYGLNDKDRQATYVTVLQEIPNEVLSKACKKLILEQKFFPAVSEIVDACKSLIGTVDDASRVKSWDEAWREIQIAMQRTPWHKKTTFSRPEIEIAVNAYGWYELQCSLEADMPIIRAQLRRFYEDACERSAEQSLNKYVLGQNSDALLGFNETIKRLSEAKKI